MIFDILLTFSIVANLFFILYVRWLISGLRDQSAQIEQNNEVVIEFIEHVKSIHELEMFYGDENLQKLITHGKKVISYFEDLDFLTDEEENEEDLNEDN